MKALAGDGFLLEPQTAAHAQALFAILHDPGVYDFLDDEPPASVEALAERLTRLEARRSPDGAAQWLNWIIKVDGDVAGYVQATVTGDRALVAYVLGSRHWGRGLAAAATTLMLEALAESYRVSRAVATVDAGNLRSIRLLERLGFQQTSGGAECRFERPL